MKVRSRSTHELQSPVEKKRNTTFSERPSRTLKQILHVVIFKSGRWYQLETERGGLLCEVWQSRKRTSACTERGRSKYTKQEKQKKNVSGKKV